MLRDSETAFLVGIEPALASGDLAVVLARLRATWPPVRLLELLGSASARVARLAATCLGLVGAPEHCEALVRLLGHPDDEVAAAAEDALWSIWMQAGSKAARARLAVAIQCLRLEDFRTAVRVLESLTREDDAPAEAHHQHALALCGLGLYDEAERAYGRAVALNPYHFAALAGLGHVHAERGQLAEALHWYRKALEIHPRLREIRDIIPQLEAAVRRRIVA